MKWRIFPVNCSKSTKLPLPPPNQNSHKHASVIQLVAVERDARKGRGRDNSPPCWFSWFFVELIPRKGSEEKLDEKIGLRPHATKCVCPTLLSPFTCQHFSKKENMHVYALVWIWRR